MAEGGVLHGTKLGDSLGEIEQILGDPETLGTVLEWVRNEAQALDERVGGVEERIGEALDRLEPQLSPGAQELVRAMRSVASEHSGQMRAILGLER